MKKRTYVLVVLQGNVEAYYEYQKRLQTLSDEITKVYGMINGNIDISYSACAAGDGRMSTIVSFKSAVMKTQKLTTPI
jgi:hypothetical protein